MDKNCERMFLDDASIMCLFRELYRIGVYLNIKDLDKLVALLKSEYRKHFVNDDLNLMHFDILFDELSEKQEEYIKYINIAINKDYSLEMIIDFINRH